MKKNKHTRDWFKNRVGKLVAINGPANLFNQVVIASEQHAKALHLMQAEKNWSFSEC